jgi:pimeloyl-ACP methyl ester carboxylesterase
MMIAIRIAFLAALLSGLVCRSTAAADLPIDVKALAPFACPDDQDLVDRKIIRHCGHVAVPGGKLAVVVLIPPDPEKAKRTPTVFVHGGPGFGIVDVWASIGSLRFAPDAPLVIFDQRSTGLSEPKLCEFLDADHPALDTLTPEALHERALRDMRRCTAELRDVDLAAYGTLGTVRDMEHLREALRIEKWNVYGISYGTTVTLAYLSAHPDRVRAAVIDSVYPPEMRAFSSILPDFFSALDALNRACRPTAVQTTLRRHTQCSRPSNR